MPDGIPHPCDKQERVLSALSLRRRHVEITTLLEGTEARRLRVMTRQVVRFAVVDSQTGRHSGVWRLWALKNDVYLAASPLGGVLKVSLHQGSWRVAYTAEHWVSGEVPRNAPGPDRTIWEIEEIPRIRAGVQHAWYLAYPPDTLIYDEPLKANVVRVPDAGEDSVVHINVWICEPTVTIRPQHAVGPDEPLALEDGRLVWLGRDIGRYQREDHIDKSLPVVSTMIEFGHPDERGDTPGFVMRTVSLALGDDVTPGGDAAALDDRAG